MFQKILILMMCVLMSLSLIACNSSVNNESLGNTPPVTEDIVEDIIENTTENESLSNPNAPNYRDDTIMENMGGITTCMIGETIVIQNCKITLEGYEVKEGNQWNIPDNDCFVGINFTIENIGETIFNISDVMKFTGYVDNCYTNDKWITTSYFGNYIDVNLSPQKYVNGWIVYDVNYDWEKLEVDFIYSDEDIIEARFLIENK